MAPEMWLPRDVTVRLDNSVPPYYREVRIVEEYMSMVDQW